jgi:hypothetical protein
VKFRQRARSLSIKVLVSMTPTNDDDVRQKRKSEV